jgi:beta-lactamase regulating signal transducer with metallopeptidase domain
VGSAVNGEHFTVSARWGLPVELFVLGVGVIYLAGVMAFMGVRVYKHLRLRAWLRHGRQPSPQLEKVFQQLCREFNIRRCRLLVLPQASSPATVYWWSPRVIVPEICEDLAGTPQLRNAIRHELIHTLRCDYLWASLSNFICGLLFFHPAVWNARKHMSMQRELACDLGVVETHPEHRADYADSLARFMRLLMLHQSPSWGIDFVSTPSVLGTRIRYILSEPVQPPRWKKVFAEMATAAFIIVFAAVSPALSISIDFTPERPQETAVVTASPEQSDPARRASPVRAHHGSALVPGTVQYQDTLTTLPLRNTVEDAQGPSYPAPASGFTIQGADLRQPGLPSASYPNITTDKVAVADVESVPIDRHAEHHERGRDKR